MRCLSAPGRLPKQGDALGHGGSVDDARDRILLANLAFQFPTAKMIVDALQRFLRLGSIGNLWTVLSN